MTKEVFLIPDFRVKFLNESFEEAYANYLNKYQGNKDYLGDKNTILQAYFKTLDNIGSSLLKEVLIPFYYFYSRFKLLTMPGNTRFSITQPLIGNSKLELSLPSLFFLSGSTFNISIDQITWNYESVLNATKTQILKIDKKSPNIKFVNRPSYKAYTESNEFYLGMNRVDAEFDLGQKVNLDKKNNYLVTIAINNIGPLAVLRFENDGDSLNFTEIFPILSVFCFDSAGKVYLDKEIEAGDAVKVITNGSTSGYIFGHQNDPKIVSVLKGLEQYLISEKYRYAPVKNKVLPSIEAINYTDSEKINILTALIESNLLYDFPGYTGIYLDILSDGKTANIIIIHPDRKVEFRCYEK